MISGKKTLAAYLSFATVVVLSAMSGPPAAESELSPSEWSGLPDYCKAAILQSGYRHIVPSTNTLTVPLDTGARGTRPAASTNSAGIRLANRPARASGDSTTTTAASTAPVPCA